MELGYVLMIPGLTHAQYLAGYPLMVFPVFGEGPVRLGWIQAYTYTVSSRIPTDVFPLTWEGPVRQDWILFLLCASQLLDTCSNMHI